MCYSEFNEIVKDIDNMDADVISFEASRSNLTIIDALNALTLRQRWDRVFMISILRVYLPWKRSWMH